MLTALALLTLAIWLGLAFFWHGFWRADVYLPEDAPAPPQWPAVTALVPARNEAATIAFSVASLMAQDYPGAFDIVVVNDNSEDDTREVALAEVDGSPAVRVVDARPLPAGWAGKLWALNEAAAAAGKPDFYWLTDADIVHRRAVLAGLVAAAESGRLDLASELVRLRCQTIWEKLLVPAYNFYFALIYPFRAIADPASRIAGAAGGSVLVRRSRIEAIGGFGAIRGAVIDDCALAKAVKQAGGRLALGLARNSHSLRSYDALGDFWAMVKRSAYSQLGFSPLLLAGTLAGLLVTFAGPPLIAAAGLAGGNLVAALAAGLVFFVMWWTYRPSVGHFGLSPAWALALPAASLLYGAMTVSSAFSYHCGRDNRWRGRNIITKR
jgi:hopene-associated glycosyltransferase HpnB